MSDKKTTGVEPALVRELAAILTDTGLTEIEVEHGELKLRLARQITVQSAPAIAYAAPAAPLAPPAAAPSAAEAPAAPTDLKSHPGAVTSPMVGTAYLSPEPGAPAFVKVGDSVNAGQTLLVVEAMKTFNPIPAPRAGKIVQIVVADATPVEFGQPLMVIE